MRGKKASKEIKSLSGLSEFNAGFVWLQMKTMWRLCRKDLVDIFFFFFFLTLSGLSRLNAKRHWSMHADGTPRHS